MPAKENIVKRLNFCVWTEQATRAISMEQWDEKAAAAPVDPDELKGRICYGGLDLAKVNDLSAFVLVFPPVSEGELWKALCWFWVPEDDIAVRTKRDRVPYEVWVREEADCRKRRETVTDYAFIKHKIIELAGLYDIREIAFDRTFGGEIVQDLLEDGLLMVQFGQGFKDMPYPTAELLRMIKGVELQHGGNKVLRWNASNLAVKMDPAGNLKPDKEKSTEKIDGITALIMAIGRAKVAPAAPEPGVLILA
jgi:phage terminase large subunit-like protein